MKDSMMVIKSDWNNQPTFKLLPINSQCPYVEGIYDPQSKVLALIGTTRKNVFHMLPKLDDNGDIVYRKVRAEGAKAHKEERRSIETFQEYYITDKEDITNFLQMFCVNADNASSFILE